VLIVHPRKCRRPHNDVGQLRHYPALHRLLTAKPNRSSREGGRTSRRRTPGHSRARSSWAPTTWLADDPDYTNLARVGIWISEFLGLSVSSRTPETPMPAANVVSAGAGFSAPVRRHRDPAIWPPVSMTVYAAAGWFRPFSPHLRRMARSRFRRTGSMKRVEWVIFFEQRT
jgi:hypothetical protein